jgi:hypothetical protein
VIGAYPSITHWLVENKSRIQSLPGLGTAFAARIETVALPRDRTSPPLRLNAFRGDPASSEFDWNFSANYNSSANFSTLVGSNLHLVLPKLHSGHN